MTTGAAHLTAAAEGDGDLVPRGRRRRGHLRRSPRAADSRPKPRMARGSAAPGRDQVAVRVSGEWEIEAWEETEVYRRVVRDGGRWGRLPLVALRKQIDAGACGPFALFDRFFIFFIFTRFLLPYFYSLFTGG